MRTCSWHVDAISKLKTARLSDIGIFQPLALACGYIKQLLLNLVALENAQASRSFLKQQLSLSQQNVIAALLLYLLDFVEDPHRNLLQNIPWNLGKVSSHPVN